MRRDVETVLADLESLMGDARDALDASTDTGRLILVHLANARECLRQAVDSRASIPPGTYDANQPARRTATGHFREARRLVAEIKK